VNRGSDVHGFYTFDIVKWKIIILTIFIAALVLMGCKDDPDYRKIVDIIDNEVVSKLQYDQESVDNNIELSYEESLKSGLGICVNYAMLVYNVLNAAGYNVEIWVSVVGKHAWNRVVTQNGKILHIDAARYDNNGYDLRYIAYDDMHSGLHDAHAIPYDVMNYQNMGRAYSTRQDYETAIEYFKKAIELKPDYAKAYYNMAGAYGNNRNYDKAIEYFEKTVELRPDYADAYYYIGYAYELKGNTAKEAEYKQKAQQMGYTRP